MHGKILETPLNGGKDKKINIFFGHKIKIEITYKYIRAEIANRGMKEYELSNKKVIYSYKTKIPGTRKKIRTRINFENSDDNSNSNI